MKLVLIPPYQNPAVSWGWVLREVVDDFVKKGRLEGVEVDVDEGFFHESASSSRDEEFFANVTLGVLKRVRECYETGKYDGIVLTGALDPGFVAARAMCDIPVTTGIHAGVHVASLIGDRCSILMATAPGGLMVRHVVERYGFGHKVKSVRYAGHSTTEMYGFLCKYKDNKEERTKDPGIKKIIDDIMAQGIEAIEQDRIDTFILGCEPFLTCEDEVRRRFDEAGYGEIQVVSSVAAAVELAKAMVNMKLVKAPRAYPSPALKAKPEYW